MKNKNQVFLKNNFRIIEIQDEFSTVDDLAGDSFCPKTNLDIDPKKLEKEKADFSRQIENCGVYGYILEKWNPEVGQGWSHIDSCFGFVGQYDRITNDHYIVDEMKSQIEKLISEN